MKKYCAIVLLPLLLAGPALRAEVPKLSNLSVDGSLEVLGEQANNETDANGAANDRRGATATRVRLGLEAEMTRGIKARVEAVRNPDNGAVSQWGQNRPSTLAAEENAIAVRNAYLDIDGLLDLDLFRMGRHYGGRPGDALLFYGPREDDGLTVMALDGVLLKKKLGLVDAQLGMGKVLEDDAVGNTNADDIAGDVNVNWLIVNSSELIPGLRVPLEAGYYWGKDENAAASSDNNSLSIIDLRGSLNLLEDALSLGLEIALNGGQLNRPPPASNRSYKGRAVIFKADYEPKPGARARFLFADASGDDPQEANAGNDDDAFHDFRTLGWAVSDLRYGEILSRSVLNVAGVTQGGGGLDTGALGLGVNIIGLGGSYNIPRSPKYTVNGDFYMAKVKEVFNGGDKDVGNEIDLSLDYDYSEAVRLRAGYALLMIGDGAANGFAVGNAPSDDVTKLFAKLTIKWGKRQGEEAALSAPSAPAPAKAAPKAKGR